MHPITVSIIFLIPLIVYAISWLVYRGENGANVMGDRIYYIAVMMQIIAAIVIMRTISRGGDSN